MSAKERFLDYYLKAKSKGTYKSYKRGLELFLEWYRKDADTVLAERKADIASGDFERVKNFDRQVEYFYKWELERNEHHREPYSPSSARTNTLGIRQFFNYFGMPINPNIPMPPPSGKTYILKIEELRAMYQFADLQGKVILSLGLDLAWRIGDFIELEKEDMPDLNQTAPIPFQQITQKENVMSATFLSTETVELLKGYIPTLPKDNPYLFPSKIVKHNHMKDESINKHLKKLAKKAKINIPKGKRLTFHSLRKRFLSTAYSLGVDSEHAKLMVGKSIDASIETYIEDANFKNSFIKVRQEDLTLSTGTIKSEIQMKDEKITRLETELKDTKGIVKVLISLLGEELAKKAIEKLRQNDLPTTEKDGKPLTLNKMLSTLADYETEQERQEYQKLLDETNGFNGKPTKEKEEVRFT